MECWLRKETRFCYVDWVVCDNYDKFYWGSCTIKTIIYRGKKLELGMLIEKRNKLWYADGVVYYDMQNKNFRTIYLIKLTGKIN